LKNSPLPPGVGIHHGSYVLRRNRKKITLCRVTDGDKALQLALAQLPTRDEPAPVTLHELFERYKATVHEINVGLANKKPATRKQYIDIIDRYLDPGFGELPIGRLTAGMVTTYMTLRHSGKIVAPKKKNPKYGVTAAANRERAVFSAVLSYACGYDWLPGNVVKMTKKLKEKARERSPSGIEMQIAQNVVPPWYADYFEFLYLTGMRGQDARAMTRSKLDELGIHYREGKTDKKRNMRWSETLAALVERCFERNRGRARRYKLIENDYLFCGKSGGPLTASAVSSMWGRLKKQGHRGAPGDTWNGHDIRAAAHTDRPGILGDHTKPETYDRDGYTAPVK
jgi:integrase